MPQRPPTWISYAYSLSAGLALLASLWVILAEGDEHSSHASRSIADLTINLNGQPVREHCTTCHPQGGRPDPDNLEQIVASHPEIEPHLTDKLGCTGCHLGEGMALDMNISHGLPGHGARQVLAGKDTLASCYRCHPLDPLAGAEKAWQGYQLFVAKGCSSCHHVAGLGRGGYFGPDLSEIGSLLGLDQIQEAIRNPQLEPPNSIMPRFPLSKSQAREIAYFLKSRITNPPYATPMQIQSGIIRLPEVEVVPPGLEPGSGEAVLYRGQCLACHQFREQDGRVAPDLTYIGHLRDTEYLRRFLDNPSGVIPGARMPRIRLPAADDKQLLAFLAHEAIGPLSSPMAMPSGAPLAKERGKVLYMQLCQRCHAAEGDGHGPIQPNLANFPRAFANNAGYFRSRSPERLRERLSKGIPATSMPAYGRLLDKKQQEQVLELIFMAFIGIEQSDWRPPGPLPPKPDGFLGLAERTTLFNEKCSRCHGASGTGKGPQAQQYLPRPRNLRNTDYFAALSDADIGRAIAFGISGTAMPAFAEQLDPQQLWSLVNQLRQFADTRSAGASGP